jgi:hypothetical protein
MSSSIYGWGGAFKACIAWQPGKTRSEDASREPLKIAFSGNAILKIQLLAESKAVNF